MNYQTLTEMLLDRVDSDGYVNVIESQGKRQALTYRDLMNRAKARLAQLQRSGLQPGAQLIIQTADIAHFIEGFWACLLGGITAVPVSGGNSAEHRFKLFRIAKKLNQSGCQLGLFTDSQTLTRLQEFAGNHDLNKEFSALTEHALMSDEQVPADALGTDQYGKVHSSDENDVAFIQFSSGSTSTPKGVVLTHKNLLTNLRSIVNNAELDSETHQFSWMPLTHDMGLIGFHLTPVFMNNSHSLMPTDVFVRRPGSWLSEVEAVGATLLCSPNFGYQHLLKSFKADKFEGLDLSRVSLLFNGAEPISVSLCQRFMQTLKPYGLNPRSMYPVYGLAEASLAVTFPEINEKFSTLVVDRRHLGIGQVVKVLEERTASPDNPLFASTGEEEHVVEFVSEGKPVLGVEITLRDVSGTPLPTGTVGRLCIRGDNVTQGYLHEADLNAQTISEDGWLDTGDLGFQHKGNLYITGRAKDIIFVSGQNVYPHDLEEIILQANLTERGKLAISSLPLAETGEEKLLLFVLHRGEARDLAEPARAMTRLLSEAAGVAVHAVVPVSRIPKTTSGKIQRYLLVESYQQGEFEGLEQQVSESPDEVAPAAELGEEQDTQSRLLAICNAQISELLVTADDNLFDLGISSLTLSQIHAAIEDTWPDQVDITDLFDYPTVAELARFLEKRNAA